jgi:hypothetical protein
MSEVTEPEVVPTSKVVGIRKYSLAAFFAASGTIALFFDRMTGAEYLMLVGAVLSLYGMANVASTRSGGKG